MLKCILIYLWLYCGLFYVIEAGEDDEHVHIKLHMPSGGQRKRAQQLHLHQQHHKKRHALPPTHHHHKHYHHNPQSQSIVGPPPSPPSPALPTSNYLTGITPTSSKNLPQHFHESDGDALISLEDDIYGGGSGGSGGIGSHGDSGLETNSEEPMLIPSYLATNFALFPQPTATYETEIIPHNTEGFNVVDDQQHLQHHHQHQHQHQHHHNENGVGLDNEITAPAAIAALKGSSLETQFMLSEQQQQQQQQKHQQLDKTIKNEQLLQQLLQQHQEEQNNDDKLEIMNPATKLRAQKYRDVKDDYYHNEEDMKEAMVMYSSSPRQPTTGSTHSNTLKALSVDDIWSQLQRQYLKKYVPQAQPIDSAEESRPAPTVPTKTQRKRKRNTKRYKHAKPNRASAAESYSPSSSSSSSFTWPSNILNVGGSHHLKQHKRQPQQHQTHSHFGDIHSSLRETDVFAKRPSYNIRHNHDIETDSSSEDGGGGVESDESLAADNSAAEDDITIDEEVYGDGYGNANGVNHPPDDSYEEAVYQRGKKFAGYTAYGQHNPFNYHDLYGAYSTAITATVPTKLQPSTYHPNAVATTQTAATNSVFLPTLQQPSTSYQWRTQQTYPTSYQTYHLQHQWPAVGGGEGRHSHLQASALRPTKSTITQTPHTILATHSNDFTSPSSSASFSSSSFPSSSSTSVRSTIQTPAAGTSSSSTSRYKKRKNRTKAKRNRIVVI